MDQFTRLSERIEAPAGEKNSSASRTASSGRAVVNGIESGSTARSASEKRRWRSSAASERTTSAAALSCASKNRTGETRIASGETDKSDGSAGGQAAKQVESAGRARPPSVIAT